MCARRENILGNSSGFLCASLNPDTPPFFLGEIFWIWEEGG